MDSMIICSCSVNALVPPYFSSICVIKALVTEGGAVSSSLGFRYEFGQTQNGVHNVRVHFVRP